MPVPEEEEVPLMKNDRAGSQKSSCDSLQVHLYRSPTVKSEVTLNIPTGHITAESVCVFAAKASGEKPMILRCCLSY